MLREFKKFDLTGWNEEEEDRLEGIAIAKLRGKGAPKKKRTAEGKYSSMKERVVCWVDCANGVEQKVGRTRGRGSDNIKRQSRSSTSCTFDDTRDDYSICRRRLCTDDQQPIAAINICLSTFP